MTKRVRRRKRRAEALLTEAAEFERRASDGGSWLPLRGRLPRGCAGRLSASCGVSMPHNGSTERVCPCCGEVRQLGEFARDKSKASGRKSWCKRCDSERALRYYRENRERVLARMADKRLRGVGPLAGDVRPDLAKRAVELRASACDRGGS